MKHKFLFVLFIILAFIMAAVLFWLDVIKINLGLETTESETFETEIETEFESEIENEFDIQFEPIETELEVCNIETETVTSETTSEIVETTSEISVVESSTSQENEFNTDGNVDTCGEETTDFVQVNDDDLMLLARIITNEAGSDWCSDEHQRAVASVVINRVNDARFPDTVYGVISQGWNGECPVQYAVGSPERFFDLIPSERALANAQYVIEHGSTVGSAIWQAEFIQGEIVAVFVYPYSTTYICK